MNRKRWVRIVGFMARISSSILAFRVAVAAEEGGDIGAILEAADAPRGIMQGNPAYMDLATERRIWRAIVAATGREDIGLVCGRRFPTQAMGILGYVCANAPTLHVAFEKSCQYARIMGDSMGSHIERGPTETRTWIEQWTEWHDPLRYTVDCFVAATVSWASANTPRPIRPKEIGFHYDRPKDTSAHERVFPTADVKFETDVSYQIYDNADFDQPIIGANLDLFRDFEERVQTVMSRIEKSSAWSERVHKAVVAKPQRDDAKSAKYRARPRRQRAHASTSPWGRRHQLLRDPVRRPRRIGEGIPKGRGCEK